MRNPQLHKAFKEYFKAALDYFNSELKGPEDLPTTVRERFEVTEEGGVSQFSATEVEWWRFVFQNMENLKQMDVYKRAIHAMKEDREVAKHLDNLVGTEEFRARIDADACLHSLLAELLRKQQDLSFQVSVFDRIYENLEDYFYQDTLEYRFLALLDNFQMENERIELSPKFSIIKIPKQEKEEMLSLSWQFGPFCSYQMMPSDNYAFEFYVEVPKVIGDTSSTHKEENMPSWVADKQFNEARSALRLFKNGAVSLVDIYMKPARWEPSGGISIAHSAAPRVSGILYKLPKEELPIFLKFWHFFQGVRKRKQNRAEVALRRFNFGYERVRPEDKLIDWLIGFEALLLKKDEGHQELEHRLALRGSALLGKSADEKKRIFRELKTAYKERSSIVHGGPVKTAVKINTEQVQFAEFVNRVEEHLRSAIKEFLMQAGTMSESRIIDNLDEKIIGGP